MPTKPTKNDDNPDTISSYVLAKNLLSTSKKNYEAFKEKRKSNPIKKETDIDINEDFIDQLVELELNDVASEEGLLAAYAYADTVKQLSSQLAAGS